MDPNQRERREQKRLLKRQGNQRLRRQVKRVLSEAPDEAHRAIEPDYGRYRSAGLNGLDHDATRRRLARRADVAPETTDCDAGPAFLGDGPEGPPQPPEEKGTPPTG